MTRKKALVVYYSRTGTTQKLAEEIAAQMGCDVERLTDTKGRAGVLGFLVACKDSLFKKSTDLQGLGSDPADYEVVIIGTPVWAGSVSTPVRTFLAQAKDKLPAVAFFLTTGSSGIEGTFSAMAELCGKQPIARLSETMSKVKKGDDWRGEAKAFVAEIRAKLGDAGEAGA